MVKVICLGLPRTGTTSLKAALEQLGFGPCHHMWECVESTEQSKGWSEVIRPKIDDEPAPEHKIRQLLKGYESCCDAPTCEVWRELVAMYPDAKLVLNVREPASWRKSVESTIMVVTSSKMYAFMIYWVPNLYWQMRLGHDLFEYWNKQYGSWGEHIMVKRTEEIKAAIPADKLLVYKVQDGWEPLCQFLDVPVPDRPFPNVNETAATAKYFQDGAARGQTRWLIVLSSVVAVSAAVAFKVRRA